MLCHRKSCWLLEHKYRRLLFACLPIRMCRPTPRVHFAPLARRALSAKPRWQDRIGGCHDRNLQPTLEHQDLLERDSVRDPDIASTPAAGLAADRHAQSAIRNELRAANLPRVARAVERLLGL